MKPTTTNIKFLIGNGVLFFCLLIWSIFVAREHSLNKKILRHLIDIESKQTQNNIDQLGLTSELQKMSYLE